MGALDRWSWHGQSKSAYTWAGGLTRYLVHVSILFESSVYAQVELGCAKKGAALGAAAGSPAGLQRRSGAEDATSPGDAARQSPAAGAPVDKRRRSRSGLGTT